MFLENIGKTNNEIWEWKTERQIIHQKKELHTIFKNKENNSTIETKYDKYSNKVSIFETVK